MRLTKFGIQDVFRSANVTRWHSVNCHRYPSIAEHSYLVTMYARELLARIMPDATVQEQLDLMQYALVHDLPEVLTGDMATPIKRKLESLYPEGQSPLDKIEEDLCPDYKIMKDKVKDTALIRIAKLADILEAIKFIDVEGKRQSSCHENNVKIIEIMDSMKSMISNLIKMNKKESPSLIKKFFTKKDDVQNEVSKMFSEEKNEIEVPETEESRSLKNIEKALNELSNREKNDSISRIKEERVKAYNIRVEQAKAEFPELNWDEAYAVMDELLNKAQSQIDFIDN